METTLVLIKPGGVRRRLIGEITRRIEARGLSVTGLSLSVPGRALVEEHYAEHVGKPFYADVCAYLTSQGENAVRAVRTMMGATNPVDAEPGTVRGDLALSIEDNLTHSSSDAEAAAREVALWFPGGVNA
jgi:nucleoside-diphosphate kinase